MHFTKDPSTFLREYMSGGEEYNQSGTDIPSFGISRSYEGGVGTGIKPYFNEEIAGHLTPEDRQILNDHVKTLKQGDNQPNAVKREIERMNKMYGKYGMGWQALGEQPSSEIATTPAFGGDPRQQIPSDWAEKMMRPGSPMPPGLREQTFGKPTQETPGGNLPQAQGTFFPTPFNVAEAPRYIRIPPDIDSPAVDKWMQEHPGTGTPQTGPQDFLRNKPLMQQKYRGVGAFPA